MSATYPFPDTLPPPRNRGKRTQVHTPQETHHLLWKHRGEGTPKSPGCTLEEHPRVWGPQCRFQRDEKQKPCRVRCPSPYPALVWSPGSPLCPSPPTPAWAQPPVLSPVCRRLRASWRAFRTVSTLFRTLYRLRATSCSNSWGS